MHLNSVGDLLNKIGVHYPKFKKNITDKEGKLSKAVAEEWYNRIGYMSDEDADKMLEAYLLDENVNKYPPTLAYFMGYKKQRKTNAFVSREGVVLTVKNGDLVDQEGRIYAEPEYPDARYFVNVHGIIFREDKNGAVRCYF